MIVEKREYKDGKNYSGSWILEYDEYKYPNIFFLTLSSNKRMCLL